jgi:hypothetical protein
MVGDGGFRAALARLQMKNLGQTQVEGTESERLLRIILYRHIFDDRLDLSTYIQ